MTEKYSQGLQKGDLILVNYPNGFHPAIYASEGSRQNPSFYFMSQATIDYVKNNVSNSKWFKNKAYINRGYDAIVKVELSAVGDETRDLYFRYLQFLRENSLDI